MKCNTCGKEVIRRAHTLFGKFCSYLCHLHYSGDLPEEAARTYRQEIQGEFVYDGPRRPPVEEIEAKNQHGEWDHFEMRQAMFKLIDWIHELDKRRREGK